MNRGSLVVVYQREGTPISDKLVGELKVILKDYYSLRAGLEE